MCSPMCVMMSGMFVIDAIRFHKVGRSVGRHVCFFFLNLILTETPSFEA